MDQQIDFDDFIGSISDQRSEEWHKIRLGRFTSSELHKLMTSTSRPMTTTELEAEKANGGKKKTITDVSLLSDGAVTYVLEKVSETITEEKTQASSKAIEWGVLYEPEAIQFFSQSIDREIFASTFVPFGEHSGGTPDGETKDFIIEVKCPFVSSNHVKYFLYNSAEDLKEDKPEYYWQIQGNLLFTGKDKAFFISYDPRVKKDKLKLSSLLIHANKEDHELIKLKLEKAIEKKIQVLTSLNYYN
ncbi:MAG: YqaJ recombinase family protein [Segetibacter sp.]|nr:YqaJ recombinase family protein [Segetibacter sp.]